MLLQEVSPSVLEGRVLRSIHSSDSTEYFGLIQLITADTDNSNITYPFSIMSLVDKRDTLMSRGDCVRFQVDSSWHISKLFILNFF